MSQMKCCSNTLLVLMVYMFFPIFTYKSMQLLLQHPITFSPSTVAVNSIVHTSSSSTPCANPSNSTHCKNTIDSEYAKSSFISKSMCNSQSSWHIRLGHPNSNLLKLVLKQCNVPLSNKIVLDFCSACCIGKSHRLPSTFSNTLYTYNFPLELVHNDLWGPSHIPSYHGFYYYITFVDAFSRYT